MEEQAETQTGQQEENPAEHRAEQQEESRAEHWAEQRTENPAEQQKENPAGQRAENQAEHQTENRPVRQRLEALRRELRREGVDAYLVPTADYHQSEYVSDFFKVREFLCGFTGSNGTLLVERERAGLWTDGRYFIQADRELRGSGVTLFRMLDEGVPTLEDYLERSLRAGETLGFDGRTVSAREGAALEKKLQRGGAVLRWDLDLAQRIWTGRPPMPAGRIRVLPRKLTGEDTREKLARVREAVRENGAEALFLASLDDIMWLYNIRGQDVACSPVALSYAFVSEKEAVLFLRPGAADEETAACLRAQGIRIEPYDRALPFLERLPAGLRVQADDSAVSYAIWRRLTGRGEVVCAPNPTARMKAVKNGTELERMREVYRRDSAAVCRFLFWIKSRIGREPLTEADAARQIDRLRQETEGFLDLSFPTISAYGANAAMMHYEASPERCAALRAEGMLLVDSGGQYEGGTTDVTRTVALGEMTDEMRRHFSAVVSGMLQLSAARFPLGCTGRNLDILAREPLWEMNTDYKCGTGHGIGFMLNVHEGPHSIRWRQQKGGREEAVLEPGMIVTNEPGVYLEGRYGIRIENVMAVAAGEKNGDGQFLHFETLTFVPIDRDAIDPAYLSRENLEHLNAYHRQVREVVSPYLNGEEARWLWEATEPIPAGGGKSASSSGKSANSSIDFSAGV